MHSYFAIIQNAVGGVVVPMYYVAALLIASFALCFLIRRRYRVKLDKLGNQIVQAQMAYEQLNAKLEELQQSEEGLRQFKTQAEQTHQQVESFLETVIKEWAIAYDQELVTDNDGPIWQKQEYVVRQLINRLKEMQTNQQDWDEQLEVLNNTFAEQQAVQIKMEDMLANLQTKNQALKAYSAKLETDRMKVFNDLNLSAQKIRQLTFELQTEQYKNNVEVAKLNEQQREYKLQLEKLEWDRIKIFDDLNVALQKIRELEVVLQNKEEPVVETLIPVWASETAVPTLFQEEDVMFPEVIDPVLAVTIDPPGQSQPLFAKLINSLKADFGLGKKLSLSMVKIGEHQDATDEQPTLREQTALERDVEAKVWLEKESRPTTISENQVAGSVKKQANKSQWFNPFKKSLKEKEPASPPESVHQTPVPALDEAVVVKETEQPIPGQLKNLYQRIASFGGKPVGQEPVMTQEAVHQAPVSPAVETVDVKVTGQPIPGQLKSVYQKIIRFTGKKEN